MFVKMPFYRSDPWSDLGVQVSQTKTGLFRPDVTLAEEDTNLIQLVISNGQL